MTQTGFRWERPPEDVFVELTEAYVAAVQAKVKQIATYYAGEIKNWMKANAPWQDRTGNARQTLYTEVRDLTDNIVELVLSHGMPYGVALELGFAGRYSIIDPAIDHFAPLIWREIVYILSG